MPLLRLDYGDLLRADFHILPSRGRGQCTNLTNEYLLVYGPKHTEDRSIFDTSPYILAPGRTTPDGWDCDGFFLPSDRSLRLCRRLLRGPAALKFWNFRRFAVWSAGPDTYRCPWPNGLFEPSQINWAIPNFAYQNILNRLF